MQPAGAGAPAGFTASDAPAAIDTGVDWGEAALVTDLLGTHIGEALTPIEPLATRERRLGGEAKGKTRSKGEARAERLAGCGGSEYGGGFNARLGSTWTSLAIRTRACTSSSGVGTYNSSAVFYVSRETSGEFICRGRTYGYGSSVWFKTNRGWVWSGGTDRPRWGGSC